MYYALAIVIALSVGALVYLAWEPSSKPTPTPSAKEHFGEKRPGEDIRNNPARSYPKFHNQNQEGFECASNNYVNPGDLMIKPNTEFLSSKNPTELLHAMEFSNPVHGLEYSVDIMRKFIDDDHLFMMPRIRPAPISVRPAYIPEDATGLGGFKNFAPIYSNAGSDVTYENHSINTDKCYS